MSTAGENRKEAYENSLTHEREVFRPPEVAVVHASHQDVREEDTDVLVDLEPDRAEQAAATDQVPVEAPRQETHALIVAGATENIAKHRASVVGQAEN